MVAPAKMHCSRCGRSVAPCGRDEDEVACVDAHAFTVDEESGAVICYACWLEAESCGCGDEA